MIGIFLLLHIPCNYMDSECLNPLSNKILLLTAPYFTSKISISVIKILPAPGIKLE